MRIQVKYIEDRTTYHWGYNEQVGEFYKHIMSITSQHKWWKPEFYRVCQGCKAGMNEGYVYEGSTYCSWDCLPITKTEWMQAFTPDGDNYWTEWCDDPSEEAIKLSSHYRR